LIFLDSFFTVLAKTADTSIGLKRKTDDKGKASGVKKAHGMVSGRGKMGRR
jgi:hypothetical protein